MLPDKSLQKQMTKWTDMHDKDSRFANQIEVFQSFPMSIDLVFMVDTHNHLTAVPCNECYTLHDSPHL